MTTTTSLDEPTGIGTPSRGTRLATLGLLMAAVAPILLLAATLLWGLDTGDAAFFVLPAVLGLVGAWLVGRRRTAAKVAAIVMAVLIAGALFWTAFGLVAPASFFDFVPGLLVIPGVLLAIGAGITSIRSGRQGRAEGPGERRAALGIVAIVALLAVGSAVLTVTGRDTIDDDLAANAELVVDLSDFEFDEDAYEAGADTTVLVKNSDPLLHTFTIEALDIDVTLNPGSEKLVTLPDEPGTYILICEPHTSDPDDPGKDDMAATLTIG